MTVLAGPPRVRRALPGGRGAEERGQLARIPLDLWVALPGDTEARARYYRKVYWRGPGQCAFFIGALGSGGHGRLRAGTRQAVAGAGESPCPRMQPGNGGDPGFRRPICVRLWRMRHYRTYIRSSAKRSR
jgi:hypothetical protein